jgi:hypothetical protein
LRNKFQVCKLTEEELLVDFQINLRIRGNFNMTRGHGATWMFRILQMSSRQKYLLMKIPIFRKLEQIREI